MRRIPQQCVRVPLAAFAIAALALLAVAPAWAAAGASTAKARRDEAAAMSPDLYANRLFELVNAERKRHGLRSLRSDGCAADYATRWSTALARRERLYHQPLRDMMKTCKVRRAAENIALGNVPAERIVDKWMESPGHRANILDPQLSYVGFGAARGESGRWYVVQDFLGK